jgi:hypothetical protein
MKKTLILGDIFLSLMIFIIDRKLGQLTIYNNLLDPRTIGHCPTFVSSGSIFIL